MGLTTITAMNTEEKARKRVLVKECKKLIASINEDSLALGSHLKEISEQKLYRDTHKTFAAFLEEELGFGKSRGYQLIEAWEVRQGLSTMVDKKLLPDNERQLREVAKVPEEKREEAGHF